MKCHWKEVKMSFYGQTFPWSRLLDDCCRKLFYFEDAVTMDDYSMLKVCQLIIASAYSKTRYFRAQS